MLVLVDHAAAQVASRFSAARGDWNQRVLGHRTSQSDALFGVSKDTFQGVLERPDGSGSQSQAVDSAGYDEPLLSDVAATSYGEPLEPMPVEGEFLEGEACSSCGSVGGSCGPNYCGNCGLCSQLWAECTSRWLNRFNYFAGVHGFKGPVDQGLNGNFGFHEGLNWGAPLGDPWGIGYQVGVEAVHSNFSGDQVAGARRNDRDQVFVTGGLFRRPSCGGLQWGVAFDLLHDSYYDKADMAQIRTELSLVRPDRHEVGFWGAFGINDDDLLARAVEPIDVYALFYRRHFSGGGQGRLWTGLSSQGDALFGADLTVPLGTSWALENSFTYLLPQEGRGTAGQQNETWAMMVRLVWYPSREARCVIKDPYYPLFGVGDNGSFLVDRP
jgi:hypothetical protein